MRVLVDSLCCHWSPPLQVSSAPAFKLCGSDSESSTSSEQEEEEGEKVDKVYTVGCFDLFHRGHINLLRNMRKLGKEVRMGKN